jgi:hypothetical protein
MSTKPFHSGPLTAYYRHDQLLDKALEAVRRLPPSNQDEIAHAMLALAGDRPTVRHCRPCRRAKHLTRQSIQLRKMPFEE